MLASSLSGLPPAMTTAAHLPAPAFHGAKPPFYPGHSFLPFPLTSTSYNYPGAAMGYNGGTATLPHIPMTNNSLGNGMVVQHPHLHTSGLEYTTQAAVSGHTTNGIISPTTSQSVDVQLSPTDCDNSRENRVRIESTDDAGNISPLPTSSPVCPSSLLSPGSSQVAPPPLPIPASLPGALLAPKTAYNISPTNGYSNGFVAASGYGGVSTRFSTQHHFPAPISHAPTTINFPPTYPPVPAAAMQATATAMPNVVMYPPHPNAPVVDYSASASLNSSIWGHYPTGKLSYDTPRYKLTPERATPLQKWFDEHRDHPYPTRHDKITLCHDTNLTFTQVSTWFANCRRRLKKAMQEEEERQGTTTTTTTSNTTSSTTTASSPTSLNDTTTSKSGSGGGGGGGFYSHTAHRRRSASPDSDCLSTGTHDSDDKLHDYGSVVSGHNEEYSTGCSYPSSGRKYSTINHH